MIGDGNNWKGKLWFIFIIWTFSGYFITSKHFFNDSNYSTLIQIGLITAWLIWILLLFRLIKLFKTEFKKKKQ